MKEMEAVHIIGKTFFLMSPLELDEFCSWVFAEVHSARYVNVIILNDLFLHISISLITGILKKLPQEEHVFNTPTELSNEHELPCRRTCI